MKFSTRMCFVSDAVKWVPIWSEQNNVALWGKYAAQQPYTGSQNGEDFHGHHDLSLGAMVDREECDPYTEEHQHAKCQGPGFIECVRQAHGEVGHGVASKC